MWLFRICYCWLLLSKGWRATDDDGYWGGNNTIVKKTMGQTIKFIFNRENHCCISHISTVVLHRYHTSVNRLSITPLSLFLSNQYWTRFFFCKRWKHNNTLEKQFKLYYYSYEFRLRFFTFWPAMELLVAGFDDIKFNVEVALDEQHGALSLPFNGMDSKRLLFVIIWVFETILLRIVIDYCCCCSISLNISNCQLKD